MIDADHQVFHGHADSFGRRHLVGMNLAAESQLAGGLQVARKTGLPGRVGVPHQIGEACQVAAPDLRQKFLEYPFRRGIVCAAQAFARQME